MKINNLFIIFLSFLLVAILISVSFLYINSLNGTSGISKESLLEIQQEELAELSRTSSGTIYVNNSSTLLVEQSPAMGSMNSSPQEYFVIDGLVNPTMVMKQEISIKFIIVNMDDMEHNFAITTFPPPYPYMIMGGNMMNNGFNFTFDTPYLQPYNGGSRYPSSTFTYVVGNSGEFWYLCTYPGHAQEGMYGKIIISTI